MSYLFGIARTGLILAAAFAIYGVIQLTLLPTEEDLVYGGRLLQSAFSFIVFAAVAGGIGGIIRLFRREES